MHQRNAGHGPALVAGLDAVASDYVLLVDSDLQIPLSAFGPLWDIICRGEADAVLGVRTKRDDPWLRLALTRLIRLLLPLLAGARFRDANAPFKIVPTAAWHAARPLIADDTLARSLSLAVFLKRRGYRITERPVPHRS